MPDEQELFNAHVQDALKGFYNTCVLQSSPLVAMLRLEERADGDPVQALRQALREALAKLKPAATVPFGSAEWLGYRIMWTRYINARSQAATCEELGISSSTYYRYIREAKTGVVESLWRRYQKLEQQRAEALPEEGPSIAREATRLARTSRRQRIDLRDFMAEVQRTIQPLAQQAQCTLKVETPTPIPEPFVDPGLLNQIVLSVLSETLYLAEGGQLTITISAHEDASLWRLAPLHSAQVAALGGAESASLELGRTLVQAYRGKLWLEQEGASSSLCFTLPIARPPMVLVIDDDPDMPRLYGHYLQSLGIMIKTASSNEQLEQQLAENVPDLVLLDILMPQWDGWRILRDLKADEQTASVPVVVCSVLTQPRLALALGAQRVLQKPITQAALAETAQELLSL